MKCEVCGAAFYPKQGKGRIGLYCENCRKELRNGGYYASPLRYSGKKYDNSPEKLAEIREKYRNGIPEGEIESWLND